MPFFRATEIGPNNHARPGITVVRSNGRTVCIHFLVELCGYFFRASRIRDLPARRWAFTRGVASNAS